MNSTTAQSLIKEYKVSQNDRDSIIFIQNDKVFLRSSAVLEILHALDGVYSYLYILRLVPKLIRDGFYKLFAKNRKKLFSGEFCTIDFDKDRIL